MTESDHYIQLYYDIEELKVITYDERPNVVTIGYEAKEYNKGGKYGSQYMQLAKRYNDFGYGGAVYPGMYRAVGNEFTGGIDVVSDKEFNGIPAGESLGGVVKLLTASAKRYIDSKYTEGYNWGEDTPEDFVFNGENLAAYFHEIGFSPIYGTLDSLDPAKLVLLHWEFIYLVFTETPAIKEHNLTITFRTAAKDFSCGLAYIFM